MRLTQGGDEFGCDWVMDNQPAWLGTQSRPTLNAHYSREWNIVAMTPIQHRKASEYGDRAIDRFAQPYADADGSARG